MSKQEPKHFDSINEFLEYINSSKANAEQKPHINKEFISLCSKLNDMVNLNHDVNQFSVIENLEDHYLTENEDEHCPEIEGVNYNSEEGEYCENNRTYEYNRNHEYNIAREDEDTQQYDEESEEFETDIRTENNMLNQSLYDDDLYKKYSRQYEVPETYKVSKNRTNKIEVQITNKIELYSSDNMTGINNLTSDQSTQTELSETQDSYNTFNDDRDDETYHNEPKQKKIKVINQNNTFIETKKDICVERECYDKCLDRYQDVQEVQEVHEEQDVQDEYEENRDQQYENQDQNDDQTDEQEEVAEAVNDELSEEVNEEEAEETQEEQIRSNYKQKLKDIYGLNRIDDKETEEYLSNLYEYLYKYGQVNKLNKKYINKKFLNDNEFMNTITINDIEFTLMLNNYKSCYMVKKVKRRVLFDVSFKKYMFIFNLCILSMITENMFFNSTIKSLFLSMCVFVFMTLHLFINTFKSFKPGTFFNTLYELHCYYTDYNTNLLLYDYFENNEDTKIELDLTGEYRITCDKSFIIEGFYLSENNTKERVTLLLNKPYKYDGASSLLISESINISKLAIDKNNSKNLDILLSLNTEDKVNNSIVTNVIYSKKNKNNNNYKTYHFDLVTDDFVYLPMFFRLVSSQP